MGKTSASIGKYQSPWSHSMGPIGSPRGEGRLESSVRRVGLICGEPEGSPSSRGVKRPYCSRIYPMTTDCQCRGIIKFPVGSARHAEEIDRTGYAGGKRIHDWATSLNKMSPACSTSGSDTHSSQVWALAMSPGPKTTAGRPAAAKGAASVP